MEGTTGSPWRSPPDVPEQPLDAEGRSDGQRAAEEPAEPSAGAEPAPAAGTTPSGHGNLTFAAAVPDTGADEHEGAVAPGTGAAEERTEERAEERTEERTEKRESTAQPSAPASALPAAAERPSPEAATTATTSATTSSTAPRSASAPPPQAEPGEEDEPPGEAAGEATGEYAAVTVVSEERSLSEVVQGPSPVDGRAVMVVGATGLVMLGGATRHARSHSLVHAVQLGDHLFGARSFAVLEGPSAPGRASTGRRHLPTVTDETIGDAVGRRIWRQGDQPVPGDHRAALRHHPGRPPLRGEPAVDQGTRLAVRQQGGGQTLVAAQRVTHRAVAVGRTTEVHAFQELDRMVAAGLAGNDASAATAAAQLGDMDARAFALVTPRPGRSTWRS